MNERALARAQHSQEAFGQYVRETAGTSTTSTADELSKLADLRDRGTISDEEFQHAKANLLGRQPETVSPTYTDGRPVPSTRSERESRLPDAGANRRQRRARRGHRRLPLR